MTRRKIVEEIADRIRECAEFHGGRLPAAVGLVWDGYIAALLEWDHITPDEHYRLCGLLPAGSKDAVLEIFLGPERANRHERQSDPHESQVATPPEDTHGL